MKKITFILFVLIAFCWQSNAQSIVIGTGTDETTSTGSDPIDGYFNSFRYQVVYTVAELSASLTPYDEITSLGWSISGDYGGGALLGYTIKIGHTSATSSAAHDASSTTVVKNAFDYDPSVTAVGVFDMIAFDTNFVWNGTDNILVEVCSDGQNPFTSPYGQVRGTNGTDGSRRYRTDGSTSCGVNTNTSNALKPNIQFDYVDGTPPMCLPPSMLAVTNITNTSADFTWTDEPGATLNYEVELGAPGFSPGTGAETAAGTGGSGGTSIAPLTDNTSYDFYIRSNCDANGFSSWAGPITFTTACSSITPDYTADMSVNVPDSCWDEAGSGDLASGPMDIGSSDWRQGTSYALGSSNAINLFSNNDSEWLLSPTFDLSTGGPYQLEINVAVTNWNAGTVDDTMGSDDEVQLLLSTDNGTTWTNITTWNAANEPPVGGIEFVEDLTALTGNVQFAVWATDGVTDNSEDYDFHVGKFRVRTIPSCADPATVMNSLLTDTMSDFTWTTGGSETTWEYANLPSPSTEPTSGISTITAMASFTGLTPETDYDFYVRSDCGGSFSSWALISYATPQTPPSNDECDNAATLTVNADYNNGTVTAGTTAGATASAQADDVTGTPNTDVWYSFVAINEAHRVALLNVVNQGGGTSTSTDMGMGVYDGTGSCAGLVLTDDSDPNTLDLTGLTIGTTYIVRVYGWYSTVQYNNFDISVGTPPAPPANDECVNATVANTLPYSLTQDASGSTNNAGFIDPTDASCSGNGMNDGVWYTFTPTADGTVDILISNVVGWDPEVAIYSGACGAYICEGRADGNGTGGDETLGNIAVTSGVQYWINVGYWEDTANSSEGPFQIDISSVTLGIDDIENQAAFIYYPNPVKNTLTLKAQNTIELVSMYNMLGQVVLRATPNNVDSDLDMSNLQAGTYFVKVTIANVIKTIRVIKQ